MKFLENLKIEKKNRNLQNFSVSGICHFSNSNKEYSRDDNEELEDLPDWHPNKPKQGMNIKKLDGRDHLTTWSEAKKGKQFGMYVKPIPGTGHFTNI